MGIGSSGESEREKGWLGGCEWGDTCIGGRREGGALGGYILLILFAEDNGKGDRQEATADHLIN